MINLASPPCPGDGAWRLAAALLVAAAIWAFFALVGFAADLVADREEDKA